MTPIDRTDEEVDNQFFETPEQFILSAYKLVITQHPNYSLLTDPHPRILDIGCGTGAWGKAARKAFPKARITGVDIRKIEPVEEYDNWRQYNFAEGTMDVDQDLIVSNPPFEIMEALIVQAKKSLAHHGRLVMLLPVNMMGGQGRVDRLYLDFPPHTLYAIPQRISFSGDGKTDMREYLLAVWHQEYPLKHSRTIWDWRWTEPKQAPPRMKTIVTPKKKKVVKETNYVQEEIEIETL